MHKACGWMPRTLLRYAIEKFEPHTRRHRLHGNFSAIFTPTIDQMHARLLNFRNPRTLLCITVVVFLHGLVVLCLQLQVGRVWLTESTALALPTISLRLLPLVLESAVAQVAPATKRAGPAGSERPTTQESVAQTLGTAPGPALTTELSSESSAEAATSPLNLNLSKRDLVDAGARRLPGPLPTHMTPGAWQKFVKNLGPVDEIREERLSINRTRIHTKYGCYELEQTGTKRIDPFNWSPQFVTNCRY